jgi:hypothetical protein
MKNIYLWLCAIKEACPDAGIMHHDSVSLIFKYRGTIYVVELREGRLQMDERQSVDPADTVRTEDVTIEHHLLAEINEHRYEDVKEFIRAFVG